MKKKWLIILLIPILLVALLAAVISNRGIPVHIIGEIPENDVKEITTLLRRELRREILPDLTWKSLKELPKSIKEYTGIKLISLVLVTNTQIALFVWSNTNDVPRYTALSIYVTADGEITPVGTTFFTLASTNAQPFVADHRTNGWHVSEINSKYFQ